MVTVTQYQVGKVTLMPLVEETGVVVLCLTTTPHVKRLVHEDQPHRIAHIQQLGGRRIV